MAWKYTSTPPVSDERDRALRHNDGMLLLASASPRRRDLLTQAGFHFEVDSRPIAEDRRPGEDPTVLVQRLAREKAEAVFHARQRQETEGTPKAHDTRADLALDPTPETLLVLGADTLVVCDGQILGKPVDDADALRMLRLLSGRTHQVITGVCVISSAGVEVAAESTWVTMLTLSDQEIRAYIATGEPKDKAGAYAIQGRASRWIPRISGCYFNVVGLPLALVASMIEAAERNMATAAADLSIQSDRSDFDNHEPLSHSRS